MNNYQSTQSKVKCRYALFLLLIALCLTMQAQNVTISPVSGKLVAGLTSGNEIGFSSGWNFYGDIISCLLRSRYPMHRI